MRIPIALYLLALAVRALLIVLYPDPAYPDAYYYVDVARALQAGHGFNIDFIWIFAEVGGKIPADPTLPIPSNGHWMPLASLVQVPFLALFGPTPWASALPFALIGSLAAPLTWAIAREAGSSRTVALGAGVLVAVPALLTAFMAQPDNFSLYQPLVAGALWLTARGLKGHPRSFVLAGLLTGLATLARNDGLLVGFVVALAFLWDRRRTRRAAQAQAGLGAQRGSAAAGGSVLRAPGGGPALRAPAIPLRAPAIPLRAPAIPFPAAVASFLLFLVVMAPWWARQLAVFGTLSPSTASGRVLFIQRIDEWNSISGQADLAHLLALGWGPLLWSRVLGLVAAIGIYAVLVGAIVLVPFMLVGAWVRRRSVDFGPFFLFAFVLFSFSALVSAIHVPGGTFIHSAVALAPHSYILALEGVAVIVAWLARRRRHWEMERATVVFSRGVVALTIVFGLLSVGAVHGTWGAVRAERRAVANALERLSVPATDRLMTIDAAGYKYFTGRGGVVLVNDPLETIRSVAVAYDIRWLVLERGDSVPAMEPVLTGRARPVWIGAPVFSLPAPAGSEGSAPAVAIFPVCTMAGDARCATASAGARGAGTASAGTTP